MANIIRFFADSWTGCVSLNMVLALGTLALLGKATEEPDRAEKPVRFDTGNSWTFNPGRDPFGKNALLDLRYLNEKEAGSTGFIKRDKEGSGFTLGDGTPVRFWAVGDTCFKLNNAELAYHARFLAKQGINMVRMHASLPPKGAGKKITDVDEAEIDRAWRFVAAMKREGIYTTISPFWANGDFSGSAASWNLEGYGDKADIWALIFFNDELKNAYKIWMKALLTQNNPYTGIPLAKDPALAIVQIQNEDSLFFWTLQGVKPPQMAILEGKWSKWVEKKYGSLSDAIKAWDNAKITGDKIPEGKAALLPVWQMTQNLKGELALRMHDQVRFLGEIQLGFYVEMTKYLREELGCQQLINASNWKTADTEKLNDLERWTYTSSDIQAVNRYFGGGQHLGPNNGWRIDPGDFFEDQSVFKNPTALPTNIKHVVQQPMMVTESSWTFPLMYESEGPFLVSAYGSLTGIGPFFWFNVQSAGFNLEPYFPYYTFKDGQRGVNKFNLNPGTQTQFPAAALLYRTNAVRRSEAVVHEERPLADLWDRKNPMLSEGQSFDPNRQTVFNEGATGKSQVDPLAFLVGRVEVKYGGEATNTRVLDLTKSIDPVNKTVTSVTGELKFNYGIGYSTMNTPRAQGASGFLGYIQEPIQLSDTVIDSTNKYVTVILVAMDDKPLKESAKILVQVGTVMRPTGWTSQRTTIRPEGSKTSLHGEKVINTGKMPWKVANTRVKIKVKNPGLTRAIQLDLNGYRGRPIKTTTQDGSLEMELPADCLYAVLEK